MVRAAGWKVDTFKIFLQDTLVCFIVVSCKAHRTSKHFIFPHSDIWSITIHNNSHFITIEIIAALWWKKYLIMAAVLKWLWSSRREMIFANCNTISDVAEPEPVISVPSQKWHLIIVRVFQITGTQYGVVYDYAICGKVYKSIFF